MVRHERHSDTSIYTCTLYYKPMGDLPYISSEQAGRLIIRTELIYMYIISVLYIQEL